MEIRKEFVSSYDNFSMLLSLCDSFVKLNLATKARINWKIKHSLHGFTCGKLNLKHDY